mmetsp:Transcript_133773/g.286092  ORF Transcript_133773/g.286092 Transcript_133773/m.286092 type:complete len:261 (-) Transcript_133773:131-913(-)
MAAKRASPLVLCGIVLLVLALDSCAWLFVPGAKTRARTLRTGRREQNLATEDQVAEVQTLVANLELKAQKLRHEATLSQAALAATRSDRVQSIFRSFCALGTSPRTSLVCAQQLRDGAAEILNIHLSTEHAQRIVKEHDKDGDGALNIMEFASWASAREQLEQNGEQGVAYARQALQPSITDRIKSASSDSPRNDSLDKSGNIASRLFACMAIALFWIFIIAGWYAILASTFYSVADDCSSRMAPDTYTLRYTPISREPK